MSKSNATENDIQKLVFLGNVPAWNANSDLYLSAHTADPGEGGNQSTNEANYTGYARVAVPRSALGFTVVGNLVVNAALIQLPVCAGGNNTLTHWALGLLSSGAGQIVHSGENSAPLSVSNGIQPQYLAGQISISED